MVIGCYLPPNYKTARGRRALDFVASCVTQVKRKYDDPFIVMAGDFNQWDVGEVLADFVDLHEAGCGPTRDGRSIDRLFTNFEESITEAGTLPPLETDDPCSKRSDHLIGFAKAALPRTVPVKWLSYSYRYFNEDSPSFFLGGGGWRLSIGGRLLKLKPAMRRRRSTRGRWLG